jgi:hypothetical protein
MVVIVSSFAFHSLNHRAAGVSYVLCDCTSQRSRSHAGGGEAVRPQGIGCSADKIDHSQSRQNATPNRALAPLAAASGSDASKLLQKCLSEQQMEPAKVCAPL